MAEDNLKAIVEGVYQKIKNGGDPEEKEIELKSEWYPLKKDQKEQISKFLKEVVAIANTVRPNTGYLIIGLDENTGTIKDSPIKESGLNDKIDFEGLVAKHVEKPFDFDVNEVETVIDGESKIVSVIQIPLSSTKPHVIKNFESGKQNLQNYIPVKKATGVYPASQSDLELIYYDRGNIVPLHGLSILSPYTLNISPENSFSKVSTTLIFENYGKKPVVVSSLSLNVTYVDADVYQPDETVKFELVRYHIDDSSVGNEFSFNHNPLLVRSNDAVFYTCHFRLTTIEGEKETIELLNKYSFYYYFSAMDVVDNAFYSEEYKRD